MLLCKYTSALKAKIDRNHLGIYGNCPTNGNNYCVTTMTQRFRSKYATIKFYSSKFAQVH